MNTFWMRTGSSGGILRAS